VGIEGEEPSALEGMSDEEYDRRVGEAIGTLMDRIEDMLRSDDPVEAELLYAAAPAALRNLLAHFVAEECVDQPRPYKLVKETVRDLDLEGLALAVLKDLQAEDAKRGGGAAG
jgi:hypothetical protein